MPELWCGGPDRTGRRVVIGRLRRGLVTALVAAYVGIAPSESSHVSVVDLPPARVLAVGEPTPLLAVRR
ncbi:MAG: hypothetical protein R3290_12855 [Acidimicrobiia bacterium]|nr:hypothetical protein [Acidimicrobiia bacterium]